MAVTILFRTISLFQMSFTCTYMYEADQTERAQYKYLVVVASVCSRETLDILGSIFLYNIMLAGKWFKHL